MVVTREEKATGVSDENEDNDEDGSNYSGDKDDNAAITADGEDDERHRGQSIYKQQSILQKMAVATMLRRRSGSEMEPCSCT